LTTQLEYLYQICGQETPVLYSTAAVALSLDDENFTLERLRLEVDDQGFTRTVHGPANARVATAVRRAAFLDWFVDEISPPAAGGKNP